ncbi:hypothetical protein [Streptomyces cinereoruber]|uniref:hypothetical protein n=1 Tax=Streptomyces cinereoruber TaxID=67260 RepID=UPI0036446B38
MVEQRKAAVVGARGAAGLFASRAALRSRYLRLLALTGPATGARSPATGHRPTADAPRPGR